MFAPLALLDVLFQSTPSVWRETLFDQLDLLDLLFQSTPSVWRETPLLKSTSIGTSDFNPLPPCGGRQDGAGNPLRAGCHFNPLPPCGGRQDPDVQAYLQEQFQSTPSVWRETKIGVGIAKAA